MTDAQSKEFVVRLSKERLEHLYHFLAELKSGLDSPLDEEVLSSSLLIRAILDYTAHRASRDALREISEHQEIVKIKH